VIVGPNGAVQPLVGIPAGAESLNVSPNGREMVFVADAGGSPQIATIGIDGSGFRFITQVASVSVARGILHGPLTPVWSPDGRRIAFSNGHIFVVNADGSGLTQLTFAHGVDQWPTWSPDGTTIAYSNSGTARLDGNAFSRTQEIWTVPADGGDPTRLTSGGGNDMPSYAPSGHSIAFTNGGGIFFMGTNGQHPRLLEGVSGRVALCPRWSPDGSRLVYLQWAGSYSPDRRPLQRAHVMDLSTGDAHWIPGTVVGDVNAVQWVSRDALLENRFTP
jgi:Tol biopolymer transport system component